MIMIFLNTWDSIIPELIINQQGSWTLLMSIYHDLSIWTLQPKRCLFLQVLKPALSRSKDSWRSAFLGSDVHFRLQPLHPTAPYTNQPHDPWRIHGAGIYGVPWIPSIYPLYVSINIPAPAGSVMGDVGQLPQRSQRLNDGPEGSLWRRSAAAPDPLFGCRPHRWSRSPPWAPPFGGESSKGTTRTFLVGQVGGPLNVWNISKALKKWYGYGVTPHIKLGFFRYYKITSESPNTKRIRWRSSVVCTKAESREFEGWPVLFEFEGTQIGFGKIGASTCNM